MNPERTFYSRHAEAVQQTGFSSPGDLEKAFSESGRYGAVSLALAELGPFQNALEIGCGPGDAASRLSEHVGRVKACDIVIAAETAARANTKLQFVETNANERFPFVEREFDLVVALMVMEHVFDPFHFCDEVARVLRVGGVFVLNVPLITSIRHRWSLLWGRLPVTSSSNWFAMREWDGGHLHYFSIDTLTALLTQSGFVVKHTLGVGRWHWAKTLWPSLLASEISIVAIRANGVDVGTRPE